MATAPAPLPCGDHQAGGEAGCVSRPRARGSRCIYRKVRGPGGLTKEAAGRCGGILGRIWRPPPPCQAWEFRKAPPGAVPLCLTRHRGPCLGSPPRLGGREDEEDASSGRRPQTTPSLRAPKQTWLAVQAPRERAQRPRCGVAPGTAPGQVRPASLCQKKWGGPSSFPHLPGDGSSACTPAGQSWEQAAAGAAGGWRRWVRGAAEPRPHHRGEAATAAGWRGRARRCTGPRGHSRCRAG